MEQRRRRSLSVLLSIVLLTAATELHAENRNDWRVSVNGRFLVHGEGLGFFPIADTAWAMAWRLNRDEVERYLQHRKDQNFNTIALVAFPDVEGKVVVPNAYGDYAFDVSSRGAWDPLHPITTPGKNPKDLTEYDYWDHLEYIIDTAESKGMVTVLLPAWGACVAGDWGNGKVTRDVIFDASSGYQYSRWIGQRYKNKKNIIWMIGGDRSAVYGERDYRNVFRAMAEGVTDGVNGVDQQDGEADYSTTLMSYHPRKWQPNSSKWFHNEPWLDFNSIQDQPSDQITAIELDYDLIPQKPTWLFEGGYEHRRNVYKDWQIRFQSYQSVFAGGFGITYGNMNIYHFNGKWENSLDDPGSQQMGHLFHLMTSLSNDQFLDRIPDQSLIEGDTGKMDGNEGVRSNRIQATRGARGDYAFIYTANGRNIRVRMEHLAAPSMGAFWFNPRNGKWRVGENEFSDQKAFRANIPSGIKTPIQEFNPPDSADLGNDWVLVLEAVK